MIRFTCQSCGKEYSGADELAGKQVRCKQCGTAFKVAAGQAAPASPKPSQPSKARQPQPAVAARRPSPSPSGQAKAVAQKPRQPAAKPAPPAPGDNLGGLNIDLGALGPLDAPALSGAPLGGAVLGGGGKSHRKHGKKSSIVPWLIFSGSGFVVVGIIAILIITLVDFSPSPSPSPSPPQVTFPNDPTAYLPPNPVVAASFRARQLLERAAAIPQIKSQLDEVLAKAGAEGFDLREMEEGFTASDGVTTFVAARLSRPFDAAKIAGFKVSGETHQGLPIYVVKGQAPQQPLPNGAAMRKVDDLYYVLPNSQLFVGAESPQRLKEAIDQAKEGRGAPLDLPTGHDIALRVKDWKKFTNNPALPAEAMGEEVVGVAGTLDWTDTLAMNVQLDMKDAELASQWEQKAKLNMQMLNQLAAAMPANAATPNGPGKNVSDGNLFKGVSIAASGAQLRVSGSVPTSQLAAMMPPMGPTPGTPGAAPMPAGMPPMAPPGSLTAPGGNATGTFPMPAGTAPAKQ